MKPAGIILAAGESSRMGRDKALLPYRNSTFVNHLISIFRPRFEPLIVVLGHHAEEIRQNLENPESLTVVVNAGYKMGMLTSLQAGLRAVPSDASTILFTLVDHPAVEAATVDHLIVTFEGSRAPIVIPRYEEKRGHPVVISRKVANEILALPPGESAKDVIHGYHSETMFVDVDDAGVLRDVDLPADYAALVQDENST